MPYTVPHTWVAGDFLRASWLNLTTTDLVDHETRIVALEATGAGDVVGPSASIASEIALFDGTTGKLLKRATGTGYVKVTSGVMGTPVATVPISTDVGGLGTGVATALAVNVGSAGAPVVNGGALGTPSSGTATNLTGLPLPTGVTGNLPLANLPTNFAQIFKATIPLTDPQIKALPTTPFTLIAAPGAGLVIEPLWARLVLNATAGAYTNINAGATVTIQHAGNPFPVMSYIPNDAAITNGSTTRVTDFFGSAASRRRAILVPWADTENVGDWGPIPAIRDESGAEAVALNLDFDNAGSGNLTGGNAANTLTVIVLYAVL